MQPEETETLAPPSPGEVVLLLSHRSATVYDDELYSPWGESSLGEERGSPDWIVKSFDFVCKEQTLPSLTLDPPEGPEGLGAPDKQMACLGTVVAMAVTPPFFSFQIGSSHVFKARTMRALIIYASHGGQTEQAAKRMASRMIEEGAAVDLYNVVEEPADAIAIDTYDAVILGSPSCGGQYDARIERCIGEYRAFLSEVPTAFFSVSHSTAHRRIDGAWVETRGDDDFLDRVDWQPSMKRAFTGCERNDRGVTLRLMNWILEGLDEGSEINGDGNSMDWEAVDEFAQRFTRFIFSCKQPPETVPRFTGWRVHPKREYSVIPERR